MHSSLKIKCSRPTYVTGLSSRRALRRLARARGPGTTAARPHPARRSPGAPTPGDPSNSAAIDALRATHAPNQVMVAANASALPPEPAARHNRHEYVHTPHQSSAKAHRATRPHAFHQAREAYARQHAQSSPPQTAAVARPLVALTVSPH